MALLRRMSFAVTFLLGRRAAICRPHSPGRFATSRGFFLLSPRIYLSTMSHPWQDALQVEMSHSSRAHALGITATDLRIIDGWRSWNMPPGIVVLLSERGKAFVSRKVAECDAEVAALKREKARNAILDVLCAAQTSDPTLRLGGYAKLSKAARKRIARLMEPERPGKAPKKREREQGWTGETLGLDRSSLHPYWNKYPCKSPKTKPPKPPKPTMTPFGLLPLALTLQGRPARAPGKKKR
ncbi:MAG: hypothetical protein ACYCPT_14075 [Acidimicrobiales bacterium]